MWAWLESNQRPHPYQGCALTELSYGPNGSGSLPLPKTPTSLVQGHFGGDESGKIHRPCGDDRIRTDDPLVANQVLCQAELRPQWSQHCRATPVLSILSSWILPKAVFSRVRNIVGPDLLRLDLSRSRASTDIRSRETITLDDQTSVASRESKLWQTQ